VCNLIPAFSHSTLSYVKSKAQVLDNFNLDLKEVKGPPKDASTISRLVREAQEVYQIIFDSIRVWMADCFVSLSLGELLMDLTV